MPPKQFSFRTFFTDTSWKTAALLLVGFLFLLLGHPRIWMAETTALWFPPVGIGLVLTAWLGWRGAVLAVVNVLLVHLLWPRSELLQVPWYAEATITAVELSAGWWIYTKLARGRQRINDPGSATVFLLLLPGAVAGCGAVACAWTSQPANFANAVSYFWVSHALGMLIVAPLLLFNISPWLSRYGWISPGDLREPLAWIDPGEHMTAGDTVEVVGLAVGGAFLGFLLTQSHQFQQSINWHLWAMLLLLVVWTSLRQGMRGGLLITASAALCALLAAGSVTPGQVNTLSLQGNLLALASVSLLVGASSGWIRARELRYRQVVGHIPLVLYSARVVELGRRGLPPQAQIVLVSAACRDILGCSASELVGDYQTWLQRVHPEDRELVLAATMQLGMQPQPVTCEYRLSPQLVPATDQEEPARATVTPLPHPVGAPMHESNQERWLRETMVPNYGKNGKLEGWEGVVEDITTQRNLGHDLQRTSNMLHTLVANLPAGVFFVQGQMGQPVLVNTRARQLLGQREDHSAGITHWPRIYRLHRADGSLYPWEELPVYKALNQGLTTMRDDIVIHRPDGRHVPLVTWAAPIYLDLSGKIEAAVWVFEDLTALKQAEAARLETEERLRAVFQTMAEGLVIQDQDGIITECNHAACKILGKTEKELLGQQGIGHDNCRREDGTAFSRDEQPDVLCLRTRGPVRNVIMGFDAGSPTSGEERVEEESLRWLLVNCMPLAGGQMGRNGFKSHVVTTFTDMTDYRRWEEELQKVQRLDLIGRLASGIVHDFNGLLTIILSLSQLVQMNLDKDDPNQRDMQTIEATTGQAAQLADQLLTFSRQRKTKLGPVDVNAVAERTLNMLRNNLASNITVKRQLDETPAEVLANEGQLQQVLMNLCFNARDAMRSGGQLTVQTRLEKFLPGGAGNGHTESLPPSWLRLSVADTGPGIDAIVQKKMFDPFFTTKHNGTGLGLCVVKRIIEGFHGHIDCHSEPGKGTRFDIWLPLSCSSNKE